jgi:DNA polymerase III delta prime subunit
MAKKQSFWQLLCGAEPQEAGASPLQPADADIIEQIADQVEPTPATAPAPPDPVVPGAAEPAPLSPLPPQPYTHSDEHLWDELCRIEHLVRAQTERWRRTVGEHKPERLWGMIHVTAQEVETYLNTPCHLPDRLPADIEAALQPYRDAAEQQASRIAARLALTDADVREQLREARLARAFQLTPIERTLLLVCLLPELDGRYRRLYSYLQDDASRTRPTVELAFQILAPLLKTPQAGRDALAANAALMRRHLIVLEAAAQSDEPLPMRSLRIDDRTAGYLLGGDAFDSRLEGVLIRAAPYTAAERLILAEEQHHKLQALAERAKKPGCTFLFYGPYGSGRRTAARFLCAVRNKALLIADLAAAARSPHGFELIVDLCFREAVLGDAALLWIGCEQLIDLEAQAHHWEYLIAAAEQHDGLTFLSSESAWDPAGRFHDRVFARLAHPAPGYEVRRELWAHYLAADAGFAEPAGRDGLAEQLANAFQFTAGQIRDALATASELARQRSPYQPAVSLDDLFEGCRRQSSRHLSSFAQRIAPGREQNFADLILPGANRRQLDELRMRIKNRGRVYTDLGFERRLSLGKGIIALFTGSSGTGKTMAATLLAGEQRVDLYKVDLSAVVSKYIGETEKNLNRVFTEAEDTNAIIFFDEADALFGKRGKVEEARDRWANIEVNYLLQRLEEYSGVVILATNLRQNMDEAFLRRIHVSVDFPFPDEAARAGIWRGMFPAGVTPPPAADIAALAARFPLSGGSIRNIVLDATFRALARQPLGEPTILSVTLRDLVLGTAREYQKQGKPLTAGEFGAQFYEWVEEDILLQPGPDVRQRLHAWRAAFPPDVYGPEPATLSALAERYPLRRQAIAAVVAAAVQAARAEHNGESPYPKVTDAQLTQALNAVVAQHRG